MGDLVLPPFTMPSFRIEPEPVRLIAMACALLLAGCGTSTRIAGPEPIPTRPATTVPSTSAAPVVERLLTVAEDWMGTPYRFGGTTRSGVDCSAFVRAIYEDAFGVPLTRATQTQVAEGRPVARDDLRAGDLVFFRTGRDQRHVGIYLGEGRMLHASSSKNRVLVDDFHQDYFQQTYWTARRFLDVPPAAEAPAFAGAPRRPVSEPAGSPEPAQPGPAPSGSVRSGW